MTYNYNNAGPRSNFSGRQSRHHPDPRHDPLPGFLAASHGLAAAEVAASLYVHRDREAVRHLFRVAASLDSMVVGEPQILGHLKEQYARAAAVGSSGPVLHRCFHKSFAFAKRVRSRTHVAERAVSVGTAAVGLASEIFDRLDDKTALLLGAGAMGELTARQLLAPDGIGSLMVASRTFERAVGIARALHGTAIPFDRMSRHLPSFSGGLGNRPERKFRTIRITRMLSHGARRRASRKPFRSGSRVAPSEMLFL